MSLPAPLEIKMDEFPQDGYDYSQHMFDEARLPELRFAPRSVMTPDDLAERQEDPVYRGELECDPALMDPEERELVLLMQQDTDEGDPEDEEVLLAADMDGQLDADGAIEEIAATILPKGDLAERIARRLIWRGFEGTRDAMHEVDAGADSLDEAADFEASMARLRADYARAQAQGEQANSSVFDLSDAGELAGSDADDLDEVVRGLDNVALLNALAAMDEGSEDFDNDDTAPDLETVKEPIQAVNKYTDMFLAAAAEKERQLNTRFSEAAKRATLEAARRQLEEESSLSSSQEKYSDESSEESCSSSSDEENCSTE